MERILLICVDVGQLLLKYWERISPYKQWLPWGLYWLKKSVIKCYLYVYGSLNLRNRTKLIELTGEDKGQTLLRQDVVVEPVDLLIAWAWVCRPHTRVLSDLTGRPIEGRWTLTAIGGQVDKHGRIYNAHVRVALVLQALTVVLARTAQTWVYGRCDEFCIRFFFGFYTLY